MRILAPHVYRQEAPLARVVAIASARSRGVMLGGGFSSSRREDPDPKFRMGVIINAYSQHVRLLSSRAEALWFEVPK